MNCTKCDKEVGRHNTSGLCRSCTQKGKKHSEDRNRKHSERMKGCNNPMFGRKQSDSAKSLMSLKAKLRGAPKTAYKKGHKRSQASIDAQIERQTGKPSGMLGKHHSENTKHNMSVGHLDKPLSFGHINAIQKGAVKRMVRDGWIPRLGKYEKQLLDNIEQMRNIEIQRQVPIEGFFIDGYDSVNNEVYEIYEKKHFMKIEEDMLRQKAIQKTLGCKFHIIFDQDAAKRFVRCITI